MITITYTLDDYEHINISFSYATNDYIEAKRLSECELLDKLSIHPDRATITSVTVDREKE